MLLVGSVVVVVVVVVMKKKENMESVNKWSGTNQARTNTIDGFYYPEIILGNCCQLV